MAAETAPTDASLGFSLFVGDLADDVGDELLCTTFRTYYPSVKSAKVMTDPVTGRSRGFGFVRFGAESERDRAISEMQGVYISTRPIRVSSATPKRTPDPPSHRQPFGAGVSAPGSAGGASAASSATGAPALGAGESDPQNTTIFIGGLSPTVTEHDLHVAFSRYGEIVYTKIPQGKGCGFVQFLHRPHAEYALQEMNGVNMGGQAIRLSWGRSQGKAPPSAVHAGHAGYGAGYYGYDPTAYGSYGAYGGYAAADPYAAGYSYGGAPAAMDPYSAAAYGYGVPAAGYPAMAAAAASAAASAHGGGLHGTGPMPAMQPVLYDPLAPVSVDKMNMAWMHRHVPMMTGAWMRPMPMAIIPHQHIPAPSS